MKIYLAHPYAQLERGKQLTADLREQGFDVINPFERQMQGELSAVVASGRAFTDKQCRQIVLGDLEQIDQVDVVVAIFTGNNQVGTIMEMFYASHVRRIPVVTLYEMEYTGNGRYHPWVQYLTDIYLKWEDLCRRLAWIEQERQLW